MTTEHDCEELHSIDSWERAVRESQERAVEGRVQAERRRVHRRVRSLTAFLVVILATGTALLIIAGH